MLGVSTFALEARTAIERLLSRFLVSNCYYPSTKSVFLESRFGKNHTLFWVCSFNSLISVLAVRGIRKNEMLILTQSSMTRPLL